MTEPLCDSADASDEVVKVENGSVALVSLHGKKSSDDAHTFCPARRDRIDGTSPRAARGSGRMDWSWRNERSSMMNHAYGWMGGGMWIWTVIGALVVVLLVVAINKVSAK